MYWTLASVPHCVVLIVTDEQGCEIVFGFLAYPKELRDVNGRILLTINRRDFFRHHRAQATHAGIVACTQDRDFAGQAARIHEAVCGESDPSGQLIRVNRPR